MKLREVIVVASWFVLLILQGAGRAQDIGELKKQVEELRRIVLEQQAEILNLREQLNRLKQQSQQPQQSPQVKPSVDVPSGAKLSFYGFLRLDTLFDTGQTNFATVPFYVNSPSDPNKKGTGDQQVTIHPRNTRFGINFASGSKPEKWNVTGKLEIDWHNTYNMTAESRPAPRIRHAYLQLQRKDSSVLLGQTWDVISPLLPSPNDDSVMWNTGNLGDRRPQIRLSYTPKDKKFSWAIALGLTGAVDSKDLDSNKVRDGEDSGLPNVQCRLAWKTKNATFGLWGHYAWERTAKPVGGKTHFNSHSLGLDLQWSIAPKWTLAGEFWTGRNLSDFRGGIAQGVNTNTGREIASKGGWLELGYDVSPKHRIAIGYTIDDPEDNDVPNNGRIKNFAWYLHNRFKLSDGVTLGINYLFWTTKWKGLATGTNHRLGVFVQHNF